MVVREFERFRHRMLSRGYVQDMKFKERLDDGFVFLTCQLPGGINHRYTLTGSEIINGGMTYWLQTVESDIRARYGDLHELMYCSSVAHIGFVREFQHSFQTDPKAAKRAAELFRMACGKAAFDTLESGGALPLKGSKGTAYTLHKRASYCVERVSDGARLCAVVPGVPLYDHLLGIKLMIEHDEPKFLKTANVAMGGPLQQQARRPRGMLERFGARLGIISPDAAI